MAGFFKKLFGFGGDDEVKPAAPAAAPEPATTAPDPVPEPKAADPEPVAAEPEPEPAPVAEDTAATYVIIGAGPAGVVAAETLRQADPDGSVVLVGDEDRQPYSRMAIPYFLTGKVDAEGTHLRPEDGYYDTAGITYRSEAVSGIDTAAKRLSMAGGGGLTYEKLLIATGSRPMRPPIDGLDQPCVHHCWTLDDAEKIIELASEGSDVVLLGAGFIGSIILESLCKRGVKLTVIEMGDRMVPRMMDQTAGGMIANWCRAKGIDVRTTKKIVKVENRPGDPVDTLDADLDDGTAVPAHLLVVAAGVTPNVEFLDGSGIDIDRGIVVNANLESSVGDVYAAGDVAQAPDFLNAGNDVHAIQPTAAEHGRIAALNMAGAGTTYQGSLQMNVLDTLGLISTSFGNWMGVEGGDAAVMVDDAGFRYINLQFDGDVLVGASAVGLTENVGVLRGLIQTRKPLGDWKAALVADPNRFMEAYVALL